ncbi:MAG: sensor histidine kinase [Chromatiaceae bacterium]|nr:sensor histidine kinase [Chromatiaceae bacterium]
MAGIGFYRWAAIVALALCYLLVAWQTADRVWDLGIASLAKSGQRRLNLYVTHLRGQLGKYEYLPELISTDERLIARLRGSPDSDRIVALNRYLEEVNLVSDAADIYLMNRDGLTIAASNWASEPTFVGQNFSFRPYFREAMRGKPSRYFALGTTSLKRGYYFAYPVRDRDEILGAIVVKVDLSEIETNWSGLREEVVIADPDGVIFVTTRPEWRYRTLSPLRGQLRERILASRRYPPGSLKALPVRSSVDRGDGSRVIALELGTTEGRRSESRYYLLQKQAMPEAGWTVYLLAPLEQLQQQVLQAVTIVTAIALALLFLGLGLRQRYKRRMERARFEARTRDNLRRARDELEQRVEERTADLSASNKRLSEEIEERMRTEAELRNTQDELIQAAKLATLGQMAAGISHELNQPLAAIRSYADNGQALLERNRLQEARWNLEQISELTGRMARIGSQLKIFSRKRSGQIGDVSVKGVVEASCAIVTPRFKHIQAEIRVEVPAEQLSVRADEVLLQQVLVNLIGNALQAVDGEAAPLVWIHASIAEGQISLIVEDSGSGIADEHIDRIFDPFFTTKDASEGLGLGLTISNRIVQEMKGTLTAGNSDLGGARFEILLPAAGAAALGPSGLRQVSG